MPRFCAKGAVTEGIDVSSWQKTVDWQAVRMAGKRFAFVRVSNGLTEDKNFATNWQNARAAGVVRGAYQYFHPGRDAVEQADLLLAHVGTLEADDLPPAIDVETTDNLDGAAIARGVRAWVERVRMVTGRTPIVYTGIRFWSDKVTSAEFRALPLWVPNYRVPCPGLPTPWARWEFFQYSDEGRVAGIDGHVDLDQFNGDFEALQAFVRASRVGAVSASEDGGVAIDAR
jgi:lysozyme